jgi:GntR family galactonate operon transcriptional repressor
MTKTERLFRLFGRQIAQGEYASGTALPSEAELCERFDVSRNVLREITRMLSAKRLIDAQPHRGLFVVPREQWNYLDADVLEWVLEKEAKPALIRSLIEVRCLIEPAISRWAAERATAVDLVAIEANFHEMAANREHPAVFSEADIRFHRAVLAASHNLVIGQLSDAISALQRAIFDFTFDTGVEHMDFTIRAHHDLFDAIRRKNPDAAEEASRCMVTDTAKRAIAALDKAEAKAETAV